LIGLLVIAGAGLGALIAAAFAKSNLNKTILKKVGDLFSYLGIIGLVFFFFRQQSIPVFGLRIWFLFWAIAFASWFAVIMKYVLKRVPEIKAEQAEKARKEKYLPTGK
jgi:hypothetical protein